MTGDFGAGGGVGFAEPGEDEAEGAETGKGLIAVELGQPK